MLTLAARIRKETGKKVRNLRKKGILPAVLYGPKIKTVSLEVDLKEFEKVYGGAGESSLVSLQINTKKALVLIHEIKKDPLTGKLTHVDFYQPVLTEEVEATVPLVFEGEAPAVKELGGTLVKEIQEVEVKALPQNLPHQIVVRVDNLKTFEDEVLIKDLEVSEKVEILREPDEIVANVVPLEKVEEELEEPVEEKIEEVEGEERREGKPEEEKKREEKSEENKTKENS